MATTKKITLKRWQKRLLKIVITVLVVIAVIAFFKIRRSYRMDALKTLLKDGPWTQGGIWCSDDDKYYLVSIDGTSMVYFYAYVDDENAWVKAGFSPFERSPSGKCGFYGDASENYYGLRWTASVKNNTLKLKAHNRPNERDGRLPCGKKIVFRKTDKTVDDLPFAEDFNALCAHIEELMEKH